MRVKFIQKHYMPTVIFYRISKSDILHFKMIFLSYYMTAAELTNPYMESDYKVENCSRIN